MKISAIIEKFIELSKSSTVHGCSHLFRTDRFSLKLMWFLFFMVSSGASIFFITKTISNFLNYEVVTKIDLIYERKSEFPTVTFCIDLPGFNQSIDQIIIKCSNNVDRSCQNNPKNFFSINMTLDLGQCYQYNSGFSFYGEPNNNIISANQAGIDFGLIVVLKLNLPIENPSLYVLIHNSSQSIQSIKDVGFRLSPGTDYYFNVNREFTYKMDMPYNDCYKDPSLFTQNKTIINVLANSNIAYSREACFEFCYGLDFLQNSNCHCNTTLDLVYKHCFFETNNTKLKECFRNYKKTFYKKDINDLCSTYCPMECDSLNYNIITSNYNLPTQGKTDMLPGFNSYEEIHKSYFSFYVYYDKLGYTVVAESPKMEIADLISNIGGTCGLFIGMSFLSFLEIFEFLIEVIYILIEKRM